MALATNKTGKQHATLARLSRLGLVLGASLSLGACAQGGGLPLNSLLAQAPAQDASAKQVPTDPRTELAKATAYWGQAFAKDPTSLKAGISYAKNLKAMGEKRKALAVLQQVSTFHSGNKELAGEYGRLALELGQVNVAAKVLDAAIDPARPDWRLLQAKATALAKQGMFDKAVPVFQNALAAAPNNPKIMNNLAMAHAMNGDPASAEGLLRRAALLPGAPAKVRQNLSLVLGLQGKYEEAKQIAAKDLPANKAASNAAQLRKLVQLDPVPAPMPDDQIIAAATASKASAMAAPSQSAPSQTASVRSSWIQSEPTPLRPSAGAAPYPRQTRTAAAPSTN